jgi:hypothetical protein
MYLKEIPFPSVALLETYAENTASSLLYLSLESAGLHEVSFDHIASHVGKAIGIVTLIRSIPFHIRSRRIYVPSDLIGRVSENPNFLIFLPFYELMPIHLHFGSIILVTSRFSAVKPLLDSKIYFSNWLHSPMTISSLLKNVCHPTIPINFFIHCSRSYPANII